jgi:hypothetical protein
MGALKQAACEVVMLATVPGFTALAIGTAGKLKYKPQFVVSNVGADPSTLLKKLGPAAPTLLEGTIASGYLPLAAQEDNAWIQLFKKVNDQYGGGAEFDNYVIYGMSVGYLFAQALQASGKDVTREGIIEAVEKGITGGPGMVPLRYSDKDHSGYGGAQLTKISGGKVGYFGPVYETDENDGPVKEYTAAPSAPPANGIPAAS